MLRRAIKAVLRNFYSFAIRGEEESPGAGRWRDVTAHFHSGWQLELKEWMRVHNIQDDNAFKTKHDMDNAISQDITGNDPIDFMEFGVHKGAGIKRWMGLNGNPESRFFGFDTFSGLPEAWAELPQGGLDVGGNIPVSDDDRVEFVAGLFQDTLAPFLETFKPRNRLVIRLDADLYSSTLFVLASLDRFVEPGTIIIFDQFSYLPHEFSAFVDYTRSFYRDYEVFAYTHNLLKMTIIIK